MTSLIINPYKFAAPPSAELITANQKFDYDADLNITLEDTDRVTKWDNQNGIAGDLTAGTGTNRRPTLITNGNPAGDGDSIQFDGINNNLISGAFTWVQPCTVYIVVKEVTWTSADDWFDGFAVISMMVQQQVTTPDIGIFAGNIAAINGDLAIGDWGIACAVYDGASSSLRINNNTKTTGNPGTADPGGLTLGSRGNGQNESNIEVVRFLGYDTSAHSDAEQDQNITALNNIYSVF